MARTPTVFQSCLATLTESADTAFATVSVPAGTVIGGYITYTVQANDATNYQSLTGFDTFTMVNKTGTTTIALGTDTQVSATSSGTLSGTLTLVDSGSGIATFKMNAVSSLTQTNLVIRGNIFLNK